PARRRRSWRRAHGGRLGRRRGHARGRARGGGRGAISLGGRQLALVDVNEGRVLDRAKALRDLVGLLKLAELYVGAAEPQKHEVCDEAVGVAFQEVAEDGGG